MVITRDTLIKPELLPKLEQTIHYAPIHNQITLQLIKLTLQLIPTASHYIVIDTSFFAEMPAISRFFALKEPYRSHYIKFGFHGLSYYNVMNTLSNDIRVNTSHIRVIILHLGTGGSSCCALMNGQPIETSMGFGTGCGSVMSTRCGDLDWSIPIRMQLDYNLNPKKCRRDFDERIRVDWCL